jgi:CheY-like chemotaxis protein
MTNSLHDAGNAAFQGRRILVVEDEAIVAMMLEEMLTDLGCIVVGPAMTVREALTIVESQPLDLAILDVNVSREPVYPVAELLRSRNVPVIFSTGYGAEEQRSRYSQFRDCTILPKPYDSGDLERVLRKVLGEQKPAIPENDAANPSLRAAVVNS